MKTQLTLPGVIAHFEIEQSTEAWHQIRWGKVGGVLAKSLLGKPETLIDEICSCENEDFEIEEDGYVSADMQRGIDLEDKHRAEIQEYISAKHGKPIELLKCGWLQSTVIPVIGISPDGITADLTIQWEGKCPARKKHTATLNSKCIPDDNIDQCIHAFNVNPHLERFYFSSFRPEHYTHPLVPFYLTRDSIIDLGLTKKEPGVDKNGKSCMRAVPDLKPISEWVQILQAAAIMLQENVKISNENLKKI